MTKCWSWEPRLRPSFKELQELLKPPQECATEPIVPESSCCAYNVAAASTNDDDAVADAAVRLVTCSPSPSASNGTVDLGTDNALYERDTDLGAEGSRRYRGDIIVNLEPEETTS